MSVTAAGFERTIAARLAAAGFRLRHDKVAVRLVASVRAGIGPGLPPGESFIFAIAAPIRQPAKTVAALNHLLPELPKDGLHTTVYGNSVHARRVRRGSTASPDVLGVVHNPTPHAGLILDLVEASLHDR